MMHLMEGMQKIKIKNHFSETNEFCPPELKQISAHTGEHTHLLYLERAPSSGRGRYCIGTLVRTYILRCWKNKKLIVSDTVDMSWAVH